VVLAREVDRHEVDQLLGHTFGIDALDAAHAHLIRQRAHEAEGVDRSRRLEHVAQRRSALLGRDQSLSERLLR